MNEDGNERTISGAGALQPNVAGAHGNTLANWRVEKSKAISDLDRLIQALSELAESWRKPYISYAPRSNRKRKGCQMTSASP
jgi:hypothetical protein